MRRDTLEHDVLRALRDRLMDPDLFKAFVEAFTAEWNRLQAAGSADQDAKRAELRKVARSSSASSARSPTARRPPPSGTG